MKKLCITILLGLSLLPSSLLHAQKFGGGNGSGDKPYLLSERVHLDELAEYVNNHTTFEGKFFLLTNDIDMTADTPFIPIGWYAGTGADSSAPFAGIFDGNGYAIRNLSIELPDESHVGFFGRLSGASIGSLNLVDAVVNGKTSVGILAGSGHHANLWNCKASGSVNGTAKLGALFGEYTGGGDIHDCAVDVHIDGTMALGGFIGEQFNIPKSVSIVNANADCIINGNSEIGGFIGRSNGSTLENVSAQVVISGDTMLGGLVGYAIDNTVVLNAYANGVIDGEYFLGGIIGKNNDNGSIGSSYAVTALTSDLYSGGIVGSNGPGGSVITNSFFDTMATGVSNGVGGGKDGETYGLATALMRTRQFVDSLGSSAWRTSAIFCNNGYPILVWQWMVPQKPVVRGTSLKGTPYATKPKFAATYRDPLNGRTKKYAASLARASKKGPWEVVHFKGKVQLIDRKRWKAARKTTFSADIVPMLQVPGIGIEFSYDRGAQIDTMFAVPPTITRRAVITDQVKNKTVSYVIVQAMNAGAKPIAKLEYRTGENASTVLNLSAKRYTKTPSDALAAEVEIMRRASDVPIYIFQLNAKYNTVGQRFDLVLDNGNGFATVNLR